MLNEKIINFISTQVNNNTSYIPSKNDLQQRPCAIFEKQNNQWHILYKSSQQSGRELYIQQILNQTKTDPKKPLLFFLDDYTKDVNNNDKLTLCFAKKQNQNFIVIPNLHWFIGHINYCFSQVVKHDVSFENKKNLTIFAGGPNCDYEGVRCKYIFSNLDRDKHHIFVCNFDNYRLPIANQIQYKYQINIDGYGLCYDRLYWQMLSNSVPIYIDKNNNIIQIPDYFIKENINYIPATVNTIDDVYSYLNTTSGQKHCLDIIDNNKKFIKDMFTHNPQQFAFDILEYILLLIREK